MGTSAFGDVESRTHNPFLEHLNQSRQGMGEAGDTKLNNSRFSYQFICA
jgi:hypothetical protein